jgi:hypothetical protein
MVDVGKCVRVGVKVTHRVRLEECLETHHWVSVANRNCGIPLCDIMYRRFGQPFKRKARVRRWHIGSPMRLRRIRHRMMRLFAVGKYAA